MKKYLSMLSFVLILGVISAGILMGADYVTKDAIAKNAEFSWKAAILTHHEISYTAADFSEKFDETFTVSDAVDPATGETKHLYTNETTGNLSFRYKGYGLWDVIEGVITLESDFQTIIAITVTKQSETPGLGGIVAEKNYLDNYVGRKFDETLGLVAVKVPPTVDYEVDAITGATGTSNAFVGLLSKDYRLFLSLFGDADPNAPWMKAILAHNNTAFTESNYASVFDASFTLETIDDLTLYTHNTTQNVSFRFTTGGLNGPISAVMTLDDDFMTIVKITVLSQAEGWGAVIQTDPQTLDNFIGKKFDPSISVVSNPTTDSEVLDGFGGATTTKSGFTTGLNTNYQLYYDTFVSGVDSTKVWKQALLSNNGVTSTDENYNTLLQSTFTTDTEGTLTLYTSTSNNNVSFLFETDGLFGKIKGVMTLNSDFVTIVKISVYEQSENWGKVIQTNPAFFDPYIGKKFNPNITIVASPTTDSEIIDEYGSATTTKRAMEAILNDSYEVYYEAFGPELVLTKEAKQTLLLSNGVASTDADYEALFTSTFDLSESGQLTLFTNKSNQNVSMLFETNGFFGKIKGVVTLNSDFETIVKIIVYEQMENWGARIQTNLTFFDSYIGKKFSPTISFVASPTTDSEIVDGYGGATTTKSAMLIGLNNTVSAYRLAFKDGV